MIFKTDFFSITEKIKKHIFFIQTFPTFLGDLSPNKNERLFGNEAMCNDPNGGTFKWH
jgi:hypothetical protein